MNSTQIKFEENDKKDIREFRSVRLLEIFKNNNNRIFIKVGRVYGQSRGDAILLNGKLSDYASFTISGDELVEVLQAEIKIFVP